MDKLTKILLICICFMIALFFLTKGTPACTIDQDALLKASQEAAAEADAEFMPAWREFLRHQTMYADIHHLLFSWYGYQNPNVEDLFDSYENKWWGYTIPIPLPKDVIVIFK
jgi:hypothetical protein